MVDSKHDNLEEIRKLYPHLTDDQLQQAEDNLRRYLELLLSIAEQPTVAGEDKLVLEEGGGEK